MASTLQPLSQSQQLVSDLIKKLRHAFSVEATSQLVSQTEFNNAFNRVFTGVPTEKFRQIFIAFDEENTGTIDWYQFVKEQQLPKILLSLHDQSLSQISMLQQNSQSLSDNTLKNDADNTEDDHMIMPIFPTPHNTMNSQASHSYDSAKHSAKEIRQSLKSPKMTPNMSRDQSVTSLEHEVQEREVEIAKLKTWITKKGLPAQASVSTLKNKVSKASDREQTMKEEIKNLEDLTESLKSQNIALQKDNNELETQYFTLQNEHKSFKNLWDELQHKYNECLASFNKQNDDNNNLNKQIKDLTALKNQYDKVNTDQKNKIDQLKKERDDFRDKTGLLEMYVQDIIVENEQLKWQTQNNLPNQNDSSGDDNASRNRSLSAVNEDTESSNIPSILPKINANADSLPPKQHPQHPSLDYNRSTSFKLHSFDQIARRYSNVTTPGKGITLLERIRSQKAMGLDDQKSDNPYDVVNNETGMTPLVQLVDQDSSSMYTGRRRKRKKTISIISLGSLIPQHRQLNTLGGMGTSMQSNLGSALENLGTSVQSGIGDHDYADQAYEEFGIEDDEMDDMDQLQELTEQLRMEIQEEMEEELEEKIASKYDLKILKLTSKHNEEVVRLNRDIDRLQIINRKQVKQMKLMEGGSDNKYDMGMDEQKTNENGMYFNSKIKKLGDDLDDFNSNNSYDDDLSESESTYDDENDHLQMDMIDDDDDDDDSDEESKEDINYVVINAYEGDKGINNCDDTAPLVTGEEKEKKRRNRKNKNKKKKKDKNKEKRGRKKERDLEKKRMTQVKKSGFCCSSIFGGDVNISSRESSPVKKSPKRKKKKKHKKKKRDKDNNKDKKKKNKSKKKGKKDRKNKNKKDKNKNKKRSKSKSKKKKHKKDKKDMVDMDSQYIE